MKLLSSYSRHNNNNNIQLLLFSNTWFTQSTVFAISNSWTNIMFEPTIKSPMLLDRIESKERDQYTPNTASCCNAIYKLCCTNHTMMGIRIVTWWCLRKYITLTKCKLQEWELTLDKWLLSKIKCHTCMHTKLPRVGKETMK